MNFSADQNRTSPKVQGTISRVRLLKMFPLFEVLFIATKRVCLENIELKYQKLPLFWKARNRFSALPLPPSHIQAPPPPLPHISLPHLYLGLNFRLSEQLFSQLRSDISNKNHKSKRVVNILKRSIHFCKTY